MNVSEIEEYLYCPRQWWYHKQGIHIQHDLLKQGKHLHKNTDEIYLRNGRLKGLLDKIEGDKIIEIKRTTSTKLWESHKVQLLCYLWLARHHGLNITQGIIRYKNKEFIVTLNRKERLYIEKVITRMSQIKKIPPRTENTKKCASCSLHDYCYS